ncbi:MAG: hypothetical protein E7C07_23690, partial [Enterobacter sp.]|nr:hypothetical protein [Enterobacter sp.]
AIGANQREQDFPVAILLLLSPKKAHTGTRVPDADKDSPGQPCKILFSCKTAIADLFLTIYKKIPGEADI